MVSIRHFLGLHFLNRQIVSLLKKPEAKHCETASKKSQTALIIFISGDKGKSFEII